MVVPLNHPIYRNFLYKPSILGHPHEWKPPFNIIQYHGIIESWDMESWMKMIDEEMCQHCNIDIIGEYAHNLVFSGVQTLEARHIRGSVFGQTRVNHTYQVANLCSQHSLLLH